MAQNNPSQNRPASPQQAPDPATSYERAKPEKEAGGGSLDSPVGQATPSDRPDRLEQTVPNRQDPARQINAHDDPGGTGGSGQPSRHRDLSQPAPVQPDHSVLDEEPLGEDQAPTDVHAPSRKRHPRTGGKGGTPDAGEPDDHG